MKKNKIKLGCIVSLMVFILILLFVLPCNVYASEEEEDNYNGGDYIEDNYSNLVFSNNLCNGSVITNTGIQTNIMGYTTLEKGKTYTFRITSNENAGGTTLSLSTELIADNIKVGNSYTFTTIKDYINVPIRCYFNTANTNAKAMLNIGTQALPYEPYITGSMIYNQGYQQGLLENSSSVLYKAFNGASANLIYNGGVIISDTINLTENDLYLSINNMANIMVYLNNDETGHIYSLSIDLNSAINNEMVVSLNNSILDTSLTLINSLGGYRESFSRAESSIYTIIGNSRGKYYDTIVYDPLYPPDYIDFKLNLDLSQLTFQDGYNAGLESGIYEGSQDGYYKGYDKGKIDGYQQGYNEGSMVSFETNGFKTLFNSILSYPVNLISNVFDFEFMGVNVASLIMFIVSIGIVVFVVKRFW